MRFHASIAIGASLALAACGGSPRISNVPRAPSASGPVSDWPVKVGNPYQVLGQWYYPKDDRDYDQTGIASWYGPKFHGLSTANGKTYRSEEHTSELQSLMRTSYAVFCLTKKTT